MKLSIKNLIYQAIISNKRLAVSYVNRNNESTNYYIGIKAVDIKKEIIYCDIFNPFKTDHLLKKGNETYIKFSGIKSARIIENSYYEIPINLKTKIKNDKAFYAYFDVVNFDNNILEYLLECYRLDNDPYVKDKALIDDIDFYTLSKSSNYQLDDNQFNILLDKVFKVSYEEAKQKNRFATLALNKLSIDIDGKQYVIAYRELELNFLDKTLHVAKKSSINNSFLISERKRVTLGMYLDGISSEDFCSTFDEKYNEYKELIKENFHHNERIDTTPSIFLLFRNCLNGVSDAIESIEKLDEENKLTTPLKAFFGRNRSRNNKDKDVNIVVFNKNKINIDQLRVVYNSMVNHITYVKGPPGTGKTETIFNVLLSAYANNKTVLVCSNNNHPVIDIYKKMIESFKFKNSSQEIIFPMIRIGNNIEMLDTIKKLKELLTYISKNQDVKTYDNLIEDNKNKSLSNFNELKKLLIEYENKLDLEERINTLGKLKDFISINQINEKLESELKLYKYKLNTSKNITDKDIFKCTKSVFDDLDFHNFLYYSSILRYKKLLGPTFKELREIIALEDENIAVSKFNKFLKNNLNLRRFLSIFPVILSTNLSSEKLGSATNHFDLVIMDEAGQCNIASSLIPIVRGENLLLVGDTNQLQPVTVIENDVNLDLMNKYNISKEYNYVRNSILSLMLRKDNNSKCILLRYHYRCGKRIASFVNQRFYEKQLKLLNENLGDLLYVNVQNTSKAKLRNSYNEEAYEIAKIIKENNYKDVGIITPFVNQAALINEYLEQFGIEDVKAGTVHTLQGSEKSVIIMSSALSLKTAKRTMGWIKNNYELINVAVTRAKNKFIFVGDKEAIDALSKNDTNDIKALSDYVFSNGEISVPQSEAVINYDFSNDSKSEREFFETIKPYFNRRGSKFRIERNVLVEKAIKNVNYFDHKEIGMKEFDVIVQVSGGLFNRQYKTIVAFEIDGGEHVGSKETALRDRKKEEICAKYNIKLIRIPNSAVKDYESIIGIFEFTIGKIHNLDEAFEQMSLFEK